ncbi:aldose 1-epimerase family protein [Agathobaculum sp.]|uniref:aldose 1-epimerase family protein n=1 Tax=Agathobaculum sp. TaxID=2048138 RepID=UPI002A8261A4|nr:aldose 1-epimerase family protein [Agathobaculum sp.]MDY3617685.1 aldose 1-epimerase family protein [Agathobaculum sp.]
MQVIENGQFRVEINEFGAELTSMKSKKDGTEYVWKGDPAAWKRHAPILFPIVGRLKDKSYTVGGKKYEITQHGFARDLPFEAVKLSDTAVEFVLKPSEYTKNMYPFDFVFTVRYTLDGAMLKKEHITSNPGAEDLYYEVGGHDAYALCLCSGESITDYFVEFEGTEALHPVLTDENVFLSQDHGELPLQNGCLPITRHTFQDDAMIFDDLPVRRASIGCVKNSKRVTMDFSDFPYFALWSPYKDFDVPFVCLEPWSTLPDGGYLDYALEHKVGVRVLQPGAEETLTYTVTIVD